MDPCIDPVGLYGCPSDRNTKNTVVSAATKKYTVTVTFVSLTTQNTASLPYGALDLFCFQILEISEQMSHAVVFFSDAMLAQ